MQIGPLSFGFPRCGCPRLGLVLGLMLGPWVAVQAAPTGTRFLVVGGGGAPSYNEIALEKNLLYFQRSLRSFKLKLDRATMLFANGTNGQRTVRYLQGDRELFKAPQIPGLRGAATRANLSQAIGQLTRQPQPIFAYFTGHGSRNPQNFNNNSFILWNEDELSVYDLSHQLDRLPKQTPVTLVMVQCYSGSFANLIYRQGDPKRGVADHDRCGFFATIKQLPSVGCTPEVDEADYRDYSSSFFAGLSGVSRTGQRVASADYNRDGRIAYREAHAFAKVDEQASDLPLSTSESWLQEQISEADRQRILRQPIAQTLAQARPEQRHVITALARRLQLNLKQPLTSSPLLRPPKRPSQSPPKGLRNEQRRTDLSRLAMELTNVGAERWVRQRKRPDRLAILDRLLRCENRSWR